MKDSCVLQEVKEELCEKWLNFTSNWRGVPGTFCGQRYLGKHMRWRLPRSTKFGYRCSKTGTNWEKVIRAELFTWEEMDRESKVQAWWKRGSRTEKGIKIDANDVIRSLQGHWLGSPVLGCCSLFRTVNQACLAVPRKPSMPLQSGWRGRMGQSFPVWAGEHPDRLISILVLAGPWQVWQHHHPLINSYQSTEQLTGEMYELWE